MAKIRVQVLTVLWLIRRLKFSGIEGNLGLFIFAFSLEGLMIIF